MRISDWSSDVCSSDLVKRTRTSGILLILAAASLLLAACDDGANQPSAADRKSVVSGKSVSVRVDLGGRRIIKTKTCASPCNYHDTRYIVFSHTSLTSIRTCSLTHSCRTRPPNH